MTGKLLHRSKLRILKFVAALSLAIVMTVPVMAQQGGKLQTINNPSGGQVLYGPIDHSTSLGSAMAAILHAVHQKYGEKPQIGKFFQNKQNGSVATFFRLTGRNQGNKPVSGMAIVSLAQGNTSGVSAALFDDAARFPKTQQALMQKLNESWQRDNAKLVSMARATAGNAQGVPVTRGNGPGGIFGTNEPATSSVPLHLAKSPDNSASIGLPEAWQVTGGNGGSLMANGPRSELIQMGVIVGNIYDPNTQQGASMISYMSKGTVPYYACAYSLDLAADYMCTNTQFRQRKHLQPLSFHLLSTKLSPGQPSEGAMLVEIDAHDGKGPMLSSIRASVKRMGPGSWTYSFSEVRLPKAIANDEWSTAAGMIMSYRQNSAVIFRETQEAIDRINREAEANRKLAEEKSKANDAHNRQVEATWDEQAKQNKAFENYTLDYAVLHDPQTGGSYGRTDYDTAEVLVKSNPDRFEYAQTQDLLKGIDY